MNLDNSIALMLDLSMIIWPEAYWPNISANDPDPGSGSKGIDPVFLLFLQR